jgi:hypothetical protein
MKTTSKFAMFLLVMLVSLVMIISWTSAQDAAPPGTEEARINEGGWFPQVLYCSESILGPGPEWYELEVGKTTLQDLIRVYHITIDPMPPDGPQIAVSKAASGEPIIVQFCIKNATVSSMKFYVDPYEWPFRDFVLHYGPPDRVTYAPEGRVAFWFEYGLALEIKLRSELVGSGPYAYHEVLPFNEGNVESVILFPYQIREAGVTHWPFIYAPTISMHDQYLDIVYESKESPQNPFDFEAMFATATAQATLTLPGSELSYTPMPSTALPVPTTTCLEVAC